MEVRDLIRQVLHLIAPNSDREGLKETPDRVHKYLAECVSGYDKDPAKILKVFRDGGEYYDEMVFLGGIPFYSLCEHHMAPFFGVVHIGYLPEHTIVGLSKLPRLVDIFARRLQVQERMTHEIADAIMENLKPKGVGVVVAGRHMCMESRGVRIPGVITTTASLQGKFKTDPLLRAEFYSFVNVAPGVK